VVLVLNQRKGKMNKDLLENPHLLVEDMVFTESRVCSCPPLSTIGLTHEGCLARPLKLNVDFYLGLSCFLDLKQAIVKVDDNIGGLVFPWGVALQSQTAHT
jgi:hypothetical protein